ncbi:MAG TPA: hypothetical protein VJA18_02635 [Candidatus Nanoarchaeia archaeon]|nr:hypothetical protein [Candidatus Nanoarchaeia archaeon]
MVNQKWGLFGLMMAGYATISCSSTEPTEIPVARTFGAQLQSEITSNYRYQPQINLGNQVITIEHCKFLLANPGPYDELDPNYRLVQVGAHDYLGISVDQLTRFCGTNSQP